MGYAETLNFFFLPEDQDAFARSQGWEDAAQMCYYEDMKEEVPLMTDREAEELIEREEAIAGEVAFVAPPPHDIMVAQEPSSFQIHELDKVDSREVYNLSLYVFDDEHTNWQDLAGVY